MRIDPNVTSNNAFHGHCITDNYIFKIQTKFWDNKKDVIALKVTYDITAS